jgi:hypothetical protein
VLSFLDALCTALLARDAAEVSRLFDRQPARSLPRGVAEEIRAWLEEPGVSAPVKTLHHYHQARQLLLGDAATGHSEMSQAQLELGLGPLDHRFGGSVSIARAARLSGDRRRVDTDSFPAVKSA